MWPAGRQLDNAGLKAMAAPAFLPSGGQWELADIMEGPVATI